MDPAEQSAQEHNSSVAYAHQCPSLKRLNFVRAYGGFYSQKIASIYGCSRKCLPSAVQPGLHALEGRVSESPVWWGLHIRSEQLLWFLDSKVNAHSALL